MPDKTDNTNYKHKAQHTLLEQRHVPWEI